VVVVLLGVGTPLSLTNLQLWDVKVHLRNRAKSMTYKQLVDL
jgi:hypothetical protein